MAITPMWESISTEAILHAVQSAWGFRCCRSNWCRGSWTAGVSAGSESGGSNSNGVSHYFSQNKYISAGVQDFFTLCKETTDTVLPQESDVAYRKDYTRSR
jgi:hypothetical protein